MGHEPPPAFGLQPELFHDKVVTHRDKLEQLANTQGAQIRKMQKAINAGEGALAEMVLLLTATGDYVDNRQELDPLVIAIGVACDALDLLKEVKS